MTAEKVFKNEKPRFIDYLFSDPAGYVLVATTVIMAICGGTVVTKHFLDNYLPNPLIQKNVLGNPQPDLYLERDGVRYYSHVDGKSIDELVK